MKHKTVRPTYCTGMRSNKCKLTTRCKKLIFFGDSFKLVNVI